MKLIHKFFLAFFITNITLVGLMFSFIYINFATDFNRFIEKEEQKHVISIKQQLLSFYEKDNSWQAISKNTRLWRSIVEPDAANKTVKNHNNNEPLSKNDNKPAQSSLWINLPADLLKTGQRISLYNQSKQVVVGKADINDNPYIEPIMLDNDIIGWLGLVPSRLVEGSPATTFLTAQFHNYFMITLLVVLLAFIMAIVLSRHLTKPIKQIVAATNELNQGNFTSRTIPNSSDEIGILASNVNKLASTLEVNQQVRFQWVSDTSHELRTPLTVLRSHLLAVQDGVFTADAQRISLLINQVDNLNYIVDDLAQLAHNDIANLTYQPIEIDLITVFKKTLNSYSARLKQQQLTINSNALNTLDKCIVMGDEDRLQQLFSNLLENSCRYTHQGGRLNIGVTQTRTDIELVLQDSAPSVSLIDQTQLFERFYRVEKSRNRAHGGSGLGLALCKQIVIAHNGEISLQDSPLGGLAVTITLPTVGTSS